MHREHLTAQRICALAQKGDELACRAVEREAYYLGLGLANLIRAVRVWHFRFGQGTQSAP